MPSTRPSVLLVDDDPDIRRNLSDILSELDYEVQTAPDAATALECVRTRHFDIALLDLKMPGMDGLELYKAIKELDSGTVAIIVTGFASEATANEVMEAGAWQIMTKPVDFHRLLDLIDAALEQPLILIVDDDEDLCRSLWDVLRERGYRVVMAHRLHDLERQLAARSPRVVLIDMKLPGSDGQVVFQRVRSITPAVRTIIITGVPMEVDRMIQQVVEEGADAVCYKPFDTENLLATLERLTRS